MMERPIAIDLFAGCGGMSLGLEAAGFDIALAVELDPIHCLVHHFNFPYSHTFCRDITKVSSKEIIAALSGKKIDLIAGGPPCQGFSHIGKRQLDDPRNNLVFQYLRIISEIKPKYFIFENVPGITTGNHQQFLWELLEEFTELGYTLAQPLKILDASEFGAPQKRKRLILIGSRADVVPALYPKPCFKVTTVGEAISDLEKINVFINGDRGIVGALLPTHPYLDYKGFRENYSPVMTGIFQRCHRRTLGDKIWGHVGSVHTKESIKRFIETQANTVEKKSRFFKLAADGLCNTLRAGTNRDKAAHTAPRPIHYSLGRCISIREAARLHTFPDWFQFHRTIWHGFREIGNAVIPLLAKELGDEIINALGVDSNTLKTKTLPPISEEILRFNMSQAVAFWGVADDVIPKRKRKT